MSKEVKGLSYKVEAEAGGFTGTFKDLNNIIGSTKRELKALDDALKLDPSDIESITKKSKALDKQIQMNTVKASKLEKELEDLNNAEFLDEKKIAKTQAELVSTQSYIKKLSSEKAEIDVKISGNAESELNNIKSELNELDSTTASPEVDGSEIEGQLNEIQSKFENISGIDIPFEIGGLAKFEGVAGGVTSKLGAISAAAGGVAIAAAAMWKAFDITAEADESLTKLETMLGVTTKEAQNLSGIVSNVFKGGFGEDINQVTNDVGLVKQAFKDLDNTDLENLTKNIYTASETTGEDFQMTLRTTQTLMKQFGITGEEATDLILNGFQNGANKNGDLLDSLNEYAPKFKQMGYSAKEFGDTLVAGADNGAWSVDKVGDAIKEFQIRATEDNEEVAQSFKDLGLDANQMQEDFGKGGEASKKAFDKTIEALKKVKDPIEQNRMGVEMFGTMWEDLGADAVLSLGGIEGSIEELEGTTDTAQESIQNSFAKLFPNMKRSFQTFFFDLGANIQPFLNEAFEGLKGGDPIKFVSGLFGTGDQIGQAIGELLGKALAWAINPANILKLVAGIVGGLGSLALGIVKGLGQGLITGLTGLDWANVGKTFNTLMKNAIAGLVNFGSWVWSKIKGFPKWVGSKIKNIKLGSFVNSAFKAGITGLVNFGSWIWSKINKFGSFVGNKIKNFNLKSFVNQAFKNAITGLANFGSWIWDKIKGGLDGVKTKVSNFLDNLNPLRSIDVGVNGFGNLGYSPQTLASLSNYGSGIQLRSGDDFNSGASYSSHSTVNRPSFNIFMSSNSSDAKSQAKELMDYIEKEWGKRFAL